MTESELLRRIETLLRAIEDSRAHLALIGMTAADRQTIEGQLDRLHALLAEARAKVVRIKLPAA